jgi:hypothetical protein
MPTSPSNIVMPAPRPLKGLLFSIPRATIIRTAIAALPRRRLDHEAPLSIGASKLCQHVPFRACKKTNEPPKQPIYRKTLHSTIPRQRPLHLTPILQHPKERTGRQINPTRSGVLAPPTVKIQLHAGGQLGCRKRLAGRRHCKKSRNGRGSWGASPRTD